MDRQEQLLKLRKQRLDIDIKIKELMHLGTVESLIKRKNIMQQRHDNKLHKLQKRIERNKEIKELRKNGKSLRDVGKLFGLSHEAIRLIEVNE